MITGRKDFEVVPKWNIRQNLGTLPSGKAEGFPSLYGISSCLALATHRPLPPSLSQDHSQQGFMPPNRNWQRSNSYQKLSRFPLLPITHAFERVCTHTFARIHTHTNQPWGCCMTNPMSHLDKVDLTNIHQMNEWMNDGMGEWVAPWIVRYSLREWDCFLIQDAEYSLRKSSGTFLVSAPWQAHPLLFLKPHVSFLPNFTVGGLHSRLHWDHIC